MSGSVRKRGAKWYYSFEASSIDGKRKRIERVGGRTKKDAEAALRKALDEYEHAGMHFEPSEISVADYMDYWLENYVRVNCKYNTQLSYEGIVKNHIKPSIGFYKLKALTPAVIQEFVNGKYLSGFSKNHLDNIITVLVSALKFAVHPGGFIKDSPGQYIKHPKYEHTKLETDHKVISNEDFNTIIRRFPEGSTFHLPLMIGRYTGCRIGEVMALTWEDIDFEDGTLSVDKIVYKIKRSWYFGTTKTASSVRKIKIGKTLLQTLKKHKKTQMENRLRYAQHYYQQYEVEEITDGKKLRKIVELQLGVQKLKKPVNLICTKEDGEMVTPDSFKYASRVIHYSLGLIFNFHALRHTHATTLIEHGANMKDVQLRLGHARIATTMDTYTHATDNMAEKSMEIFEEAVGGLPTIE